MLASCCIKSKSDRGPDTVNLEIFMRILFSGIAVKGHICDAKNLRQGHDLAISVDNRVISLFARVLFSKSFEKIKPSRKFPNLQYANVLIVKL